MFEESSEDSDYNNDESNIKTNSHEPNLKKNAEESSCSTSTTDSIDDRSENYLIINDENKRKYWEPTNEYRVLTEIRRFFDNRIDMPSILISIHKRCGNVKEAIRDLNNGRISDDPELLLDTSLDCDQSKLQKYFTSFNIK